MVLSLVEYPWLYISAHFPEAHCSLNLRCFAEPCRGWLPQLEMAGVLSLVERLSKAVANSTSSTVANSSSATCWSPCGLHTGHAFPLLRVSSPPRFHVFLCLSVSLSLCLSVSLVPLSLCLTAFLSLFVFLSVSLFVFLSFSVSLSLPLCVSVSVSLSSACFSFSLSAFLSFCLPLSLSLCQSVSILLSLLQGACREGALDRASAQPQAPVHPDVPLFQITTLRILACFLGLGDPPPLGQPAAVRFSWGWGLKDTHFIGGTPARPRDIYRHDAPLPGPVAVILGCSCKCGIGRSLECSVARVAWCGAVHVRASARQRAGDTQGCARGRKRLRDTS